MSDLARILWSNGVAMSKAQAMGRSLSDVILQTLTETGRKWLVVYRKRAYQGIVFAADGVTESIVTPPHPSYKAAAEDLAERWARFDTWLKELQADTGAQEGRA